MATKEPGRTLAPPPPPPPSRCFIDAHNPGVDPENKLLRPHRRAACSRSISRRTQPAQPAQPAPDPRTDPTLTHRVGVRVPAQLGRRYFALVRERVGRTRGVEAGAGFSRVVCGDSCISGRDHEAGWRVPWTRLRLGGSVCVCISSERV